mmetsp:Transcript_65347/g.200043  ORF Transcript_65347/g.200043 Transcript_65347/m.200043 type:complete len:230 (+) Transcript_65347:643-1332(+)
MEVRCPDLSLAELPDRHVAIPGHWERLRVAERAQILGQTAEQPRVRVHFQGRRNAGRPPNAPGANGSLERHCNFDVVATVGRQVWHEARRLDPATRCRRVGPGGGCHDFHLDVQGVVGMSGVIETEPERPLRGIQVHEGKFQVHAAQGAQTQIRQMAPSVGQACAQYLAGGQDSVHVINTIDEQHRGACTDSHIRQRSKAQLHLSRVEKPHRIERAMPAERGARVPTRR